MRETEQRKLFLFLLFLFILGGIAILSGGLTQLRFQPGKPFPQGAPSTPPGSGGSGHNPQHAWLAEAIQHILYPTALFIGVAGVIGAIISPRFRRFLLHQLLPVLILFLIISLLLTFFHADRNVAPAHTPAPSPPAQPAVSGEGYTPPAVTPPHWSVILIALGAAIGIVGFGFAVWWRFQRARPVPIEQDVLAELGEEAGAAVDRIRSGANPRDVVIMAYKEMCDILSPRVENPDYITPREFARRLRTRGMRNEHVDRLTKIFEDVRYGHREGPRFADDAVSCLEEIRDAYAQG